MRDIGVVIFIFVALLFLLSASGCVTGERTKDGGRLMTSERGMYLAETWARHGRASITELKIEPDGSFYGQLGAAYIEYIKEDQSLVVRGLVYLEGSEFNPALLKELEEYADAKTLAGGRFEVDLASERHGKTPSLNLRQDFIDGSIKPAAFVKAVDELMHASTWWRKQGLYKALTSPG